MWSDPTLYLYDANAYPKMIPYFIDGGNDGYEHIVIEEPSNLTIPHFRIKDNNGVIIEDENTLSQLLSYSASLYDL